MSNIGTKEVPEPGTEVYQKEYQKDRKEILAKLEDLEHRLKEVEANLKQMDRYNIYPEEDNIM